MAKRKRLGVPVFSDTLPDLETKSGAPRPVAPPIANVAGDAATQAALSDVIETLTKAKREGRMVLELDPTTIDAAHLMRDRTRVNPEEMQTLAASISARGQQSPIEVVDLGQGTYGLISGWRRLTAIKQLGDRPVLALLREPQDAPDAYLAMIEENEIRVGLSYYERARIVAQSVAGGVFETEKSALQSLFSSASRAKRSKIKSFLPVVRDLDGALHFPEDIGERLGLLLSRALDEDAGLAAHLQKLLSSPPQNAVEEQSLIQRFLSKKPDSASAKAAQKAEDAAQTTRRLVPGLQAQTRADGSLLLSGPALTPALARELQDWLRERADKSRR